MIFNLLIDFMEALDEEQEEVNEEELQNLNLDG